MRKLLLKMKQKDGNAILSSLLVFTVVSLLFAALTTRTLLSSRIGNDFTSRQQAYYIARSVAISFHEQIQNYTTFEPVPESGNTTRIANSSTQLIGSSDIDLTFEESPDHPDKWQIIVTATYQGHRSTATITDIEVNADAEEDFPSGEPILIQANLHESQKSNANDKVQFRIFVKED